MTLLSGGILAAVSILSVKTGLVLGTSWLGRGAGAAAAAGMGGGFFLLTWMFAGRQHILMEILDKYTFAGAVGIALFLVFLGLWEPSFDASKTSPGIKTKTRASCYLGFLPCPLCVAALSLAVITAAPLTGTNTIALSAATALAFAALTTAAALAAKKAVLAARWNPAAVFNSFLLFTGTLTLAFAFIIPNTVSAMNLPMAPVEMPPFKVLGPAVLTLAGAALAGYLQQVFKQRRKGEVTW